MNRIYYVHEGFDDGDPWYVGHAVAGVEDGNVPSGRRVTEAEAKADPRLADAVSRFKAGDDSAEELWSEKIIAWGEAEERAEKMARPSGGGESPPNLRLI
jgi:hypothetical protein